MAINSAAGVEDHSLVFLFGKLFPLWLPGPGLPVGICLKLYWHNLMKILNIWFQKLDDFIAPFLHSDTLKKPIEEGEKLIHIYLLTSLGY